MATRNRNGSNQREKRGANSSLGRVVCCYDLLDIPADCFSSFQDLMACDVLVAKVSGFDLMEEGTYAFGCSFYSSGYCRFYWVSPDGTDTFRLVATAPSSWSANAAYGGTAGDCETLGGTALGALGTSEGTPDYDFWCNEVAMQLPTGGTPLAFYDFTLMHP